jgi:hypothetical protein
MLRRDPNSRPQYARGVGQEVKRIIGRPIRVPTTKGSTKSRAPGTEPIGPGAADLDPCQQLLRHDKCGAIFL